MGASSKLEIKHKIFHARLGLFHGYFFLLLLLRSLQRLFRTDNLHTGVGIRLKQIAVCLLRV